MSGFEALIDLSPSELHELLEDKVGLGSGEMFIAFGANPEHHDGSVR